MNEPKRQHSVPQMLQARFADDRGKLWFFDKNRTASGVNEIAPANLFVQNRQYTLKNSDGTRDWSLEVRYSKIEGYMDALIKKIVPPVLAGQLPVISESERRFLDLYIYEQWRRVPELYKRMVSDDEFAAMLQEAIDSYEKQYKKLDDVQRAKFATKDFLKSQRHNSRVMSLSKTTGLALDALAAKGLCFARTGRSRSFLIGSFPVLKLTPSHQTAIDAPEVEVWLAIDPNVAVVLAGNASFFGGISLHPHAVRAINKSIAKQSDMFAGRDRALVASVASQFLD